MANVLIIDDDELMCEMLSELIESIDHRASYALTLKQGLKTAKSMDFDVIFLDVGMPDGNGLRLLKYIKALPSAPEVIIITGAGDARGAEIAIKNGAWDYQQKPIMPAEIIDPVRRVLQYRDSLKKSKQMASSLNRDEIIGSSPLLESCLDSILRAACNESNVLITGETGTGKGVLARALHKSSLLSQRPFVVVDCASLTESLAESALFGHEKGAFTGADRSTTGLIKQADGGTLFLDEIGELPLAIQKIFLRVLQEHCFRTVGGEHEIRSNFRLVSATNREMEQMVSDGLFRQDLLYRIRAVTIEAPPLRVRKEDIKELVVYHAEKIFQRNKIEPKAFSSDFFDVLEAHQWPGNIRELVNTLEMAISEAFPEPRLFPKHLPISLRIQVKQRSINRNEPPQKLEKKSESMPIEDTENLSVYKTHREAALAKMEKEYLIRLMRISRGNIKAACKLADLGRTRLYVLMKKHNVKKEEW
jgi:two-component system NtrC family response regulator